MRWHCHNSTSTIAHQNVICDPYRQLSAVQRINSITASKNTCLSLVFLAFDFGLFQGSNTVLIYLTTRVIVDKLRKQRMFWRQYQKSSAEKRIRTSSKDGDSIIRPLNGKLYFSALAATDPVFLHHFDFFWPIKLVNFF